MAASININVKSLRHTYSLTIPRHSTPTDILPLCTEPCRSTLLFQGRALQQSLQSAGVGEGSTLLLVPAAPEVSERLVLVRWNDRAMQMVYDEHMTVGDLKEKCQRKLRMRSDLVQVTYKGSELSNSSTILDCVTENRPEFLLSIKLKPPTASNFDIVVKNLTGKTSIISINASLTVEDLRAIISDHEGLPLDSVRLICAGHGLCDTETVGQLRITPASVIYVVLRLR